jgi:hypothetical protein
MMTNDRESDTDWAQVTARLASARNYWLGTTAASDAPHTAPIWGVVVDDRFFIYSERETVKAKNIERDPRVVVHLESAEHVVIVYGRMIGEGQPSGMPDVVHALSIKYDAPGDSQYLPSVNEDFRCPLPAAARARAALGVVGLRRESTEMVVVTLSGSNESASMRPTHSRRSGTPHSEST